MLSIENVLLQIAKEYEKVEERGADECAKKQNELEMRCVALLKSENLDLIDFLTRCDMAVFRLCSCFFGELTEDNEVLQSLIPVVESRYNAAVKDANDKKEKQYFLQERDNTIEDIVLTLNQRGANGF